MDAPLSPERASTRAPKTGGDARRPEAATIFLVDGDAAVRDALVVSLRAAGHRVAPFGSAVQFLGAYRPGEPGCLVVDMDLADLGAAELLRTLAASQVALPTIVTSRRLRRRGPADGFPSGTLFLDKPFDIEELLGLVRTLLQPGSGDAPAV